MFSTLATLFMVIKDAPGYYKTKEKRSTAGTQIITRLLKDIVRVNVRLAFRRGVFQVHVIFCHVSS